MRWFTDRDSLALCLLVGAIAGVLLSGCAGEPFVYHSQNEIPEGPGIFSAGNDALGSNATSGDQFDVEAATPESNRNAETISEYELFEQFRAFKRWKTANEDSAAYREFEEWRRWRTYRACKAEASSTANNCAALALD